MDRNILAFGFCCSLFTSSVAVLLYKRECEGSIGEMKRQLSGIEERTKNQIRTIDQLKAQIGDINQSSSPPPAYTGAEPRIDDAQLIETLKYDLSNLKRDLDANREWVARIYQEQSCQNQKFDKMTKDVTNISASMDTLIARQNQLGISFTSKVGQLANSRKT